MLKLTTGGRFASMAAAVVDTTTTVPIATSVSVRVLNSGHVPNNAMPVSATQVSASAGAAKVATVALEAAAEVEVMAVAPVVHICGDGALTTEEGCDDGAKVAGDGCSRNCTVEAGYVCSYQLGQTSSCEIPVLPVITFAHDTQGPFREGSNATVTVLRTGDNETA